jgi:hypothetical protein
MSGILKIEWDIEKWVFWIKKDVNGLFYVIKKKRVRFIQYIVKGLQGSM